MKDKLERILWKNRKHVNTQGKEVNPKQIGETYIAYLKYPFIEEEILKKAEKIFSNSNIKNYSEINSYMIGVGAEVCYSFMTNPSSVYVSLGFYKI